MNDTLRALEQFLLTPLTTLDASADDGRSRAEALYREVHTRVPAYRELVAEAVPFTSLPLVTKDNYMRRFALGARCWDGKLAACDFIAVSSGSTSAPTIWPRAIAHEAAIAMRFEQVLHDTCGALERTTLAVICFPLGTWVGGMYTTSAVRWVAMKGYPITLVTPGNNVVEILRVFRELAPAYEQVVLFGYPPFLKDVVDAGRAEGVTWQRHRVKLVLAGEVVSEAWRTLMAERLGQDDVLRGSSSLYGTADAGVLGCESPLSVAIRRFLAGRLDLAERAFGKSRLPTLVQYDPRQRFFETYEGTLVVTADGGVPLVRYHIADDGGLWGFTELLDFCRDAGFDARTAVGDAPVRPLPFVYVFGRSRFAVSIYGANVFPETIAIGLEQPEIALEVTGKFVMEVVSDADHDKQLTIAVELAPSVSPSEALHERVTALVTRELLGRNSEYRNYVPSERRTPVVHLHRTGDPEYFPTGVKHRYSR